jgi:hypothetical protein
MSGAACSLDFASVMAIAEAQGADLALLAEALPDVEIAVLAGAIGDPEDDPGEIE